MLLKEQQVGKYFTDAIVIAQPVLSVNQERMMGKRVPLISKVIPLKLFLDMEPSSPADKVATHVAWKFSWRMKMRVKPLGLSA